MRKLDVAAELKKAEKSELFGDFNQAKVWVMGAGLVAADKTDPKGIHRDPVTMQALKNFWQDYPAKSNASLVEFGTPELKLSIR